jgi:hypothetical protein
MMSTTRNRFKIKLPAVKDVVQKRECSSTVELQGGFSSGSKGFPDVEVFASWFFHCRSIFAIEYWAFRNVLQNMNPRAERAANNTALFR